MLFQVSGLCGQPGHFPKLQISVEMFRRNLLSPVGKRHVGVPPWYTNMTDLELTLAI